MILTGIEALAASSETVDGRATRGFTLIIRLWFIQIELCLMVVK